MINKNNWTIIISIPYTKNIIKKTNDNCSKALIYINIVNKFQKKTYKCYTESWFIKTEKQINIYTYHCSNSIFFALEINNTTIKLSSLKCH